MEPSRLSADMMFGNRRHFRELLTKSEEGIASNILADRLKRLVEQAIISRSDDPTHKQKAIYSLTEQGIALLPVLAQMAAWGNRYLPVTEELSIRAELLEQGGPRLWAEFMEELRAIHLGTEPRRRTRPVGRRAPAGGLRGGGGETRRKINRHCLYAGSACVTPPPSRPVSPLYRNHQLEGRRRSSACRRTALNSRFIMSESRRVLHHLGVDPVALSPRLVGDVGETRPPHRP